MSPVEVLVSVLILAWFVGFGVLMMQDLDEQCRIAERESVLDELWDEA